MICIASLRDEVVLVSHKPIAVFATTSEQLRGIKKKPDGHYEREDLDDLVAKGGARKYDEEDVRTIVQALEGLIHGCPPIAF